MKMPGPEMPIKKKEVHQTASERGGGGHPGLLVGTAGGRLVAGWVTVIGTRNRDPEVLAMRTRSLARSGTPC